MSAGAPDDDGPLSSTDSEEEPRNLAYKAILGVLALVGLTAVVVGFGGLFIVLTGGTDDGGTAEVPALADEGLACDSFDGDPEVGHEGSYVRFDRTGTLVEDVTPIPDDESLLIEMTGQVVNASAVRADGTPMNVTVAANTAVVNNGTASPPYRLWIDSVDEDGQFQVGGVIRSQLDVCS